MSIPTQTVSPRDRIHIKFCTAKHCRVEQSVASMVAQSCKLLDHLLDLNDEMLLHAEADKFRDAIRTYATRRGGSAIIGGLARAAEMAEPFEKIDAFEDDPEEYVHPRENHPNCPGCVAGIEHYHRKADDSMVPLFDVPRETSGDDDAPAR